MLQSHVTSTYHDGNDNYFCFENKYHVLSVADIPSELRNRVVYKLISNIKICRWFNCFHDFAVYSEKFIFYYKMKKYVMMKKCEEKYIQTSYDVWMWLYWNFNTSIYIIFK